MQGPLALVLREQLAQQQPAGAEDGTAVLGLQQRGREFDAARRMLFSEAGGNLELVIEVLVKRADAHPGDLGDGAGVDVVQRPGSEDARGSIQDGLHDEAGSILLRRLPEHRTPLGVPAADPDRVWCALFLPAVRAIPSGGSPVSNDYRSDGVADRARLEHDIRAADDSPHRSGPSPPTNSNRPAGVDAMRSTMMDRPLSLNDLLERAGTYFSNNVIVSRRPDKSLVRHRYADMYRRSRALGAALLSLGLNKGDRVATLAWNHHAHLECYFGIPAAGGVMHTLNLRLSPSEIGAIAADAGDRFLVVDDILLPLYEQFAPLHRFERVIVFPFSGAPVRQGFEDYEALLARADADGFAYVAHDENDPVSMCYTSGTTGRAKGVVYSHRSTILHTLAGNQPDFWGMRGTDVLMPVAPMFHANAWGTPYGAVMVGAKIVFPGPHLHPNDLLDLMQAEPPTIARSEER